MGAPVTTAPIDPMEGLEQTMGVESQVPVEGMPVVADEFEQEAEREIEASKGLDAGEGEGKMKLVHQVCWVLTS
jgi:ATP-dependent RNA helicase DOB1